MEAWATPPSSRFRASVALREVDAAIALVVAGVAGRVRLAGMPFLDAVATTARSRARAAGLAFRLEPTDRQGAVTATIGPFEPAASG